MAGVCGIIMFGGENGGVAFKNNEVDWDLVARKKEEFERKEKEVYNTGLINMQSIEKKIPDYYDHPRYGRVFKYMDNAAKAILDEFNGRFDISISEFTSSERFQRVFGFEEMRNENVSVLEYVLLAVIENNLLPSLKDKRVNINHAYTFAVAGAAILFGGRNGGFAQVHNNGQIDWEQVKKSKIEFGEVVDRRNKGEEVSVLEPTIDQASQKPVAARSRKPHIAVSVSVASDVFLGDIKSEFPPVSGVQKEKKPRQRKERRKHTTHTQKGRARVKIGLFVAQPARKENNASVVEEKALIDNKEGLTTAEEGAGVAQEVAVAGDLQPSVEVVIPSVALESRIKALRDQYPGLKRLKEKDFSKGVVSFLFNAVKKNAELIAGKKGDDLGVLEVQIALIGDQDTIKNYLPVEEIAMLEAVVFLEAVMEQSLGRIITNDTKKWKINHIMRALRRILRHMGDERYINKEKEEAQLENLGELTKAVLGPLLESKK